jgi:two-component system KDP operon response regulator KdpE
MTEQENILIIDDENQIRRLLDITLSANGFRTMLTTNGKEGLVMAATHHPGLVILDLGLPDIDGHEVLKKLREWYFKPVIILSVRSAEEEIIRALDHGANDYLTKPFRTGELLARVRAALRTGENKTGEAVIVSGKVNIDLANHVVRKQEEIIKLTSTEFSLLSLLAQNRGRVLTHQFILKEVWGFGYIEQSQYLRVFIAQLRKKLEDDPAKPAMIVTESGIGYRFN